MLKPSTAVPSETVVAALSPQLALNVSFGLEVFALKTSYSLTDFKLPVGPARHLVYPEYTLATHFLTPHNSRASKVPLRIGVSKQCCLLCGKLLLILSKEKGKKILSDGGGINIFGCYEKAHSDWGFPPKLPGSPTHTEMTKEINRWMVKAITMY